MWISPLLPTLENPSATQGESPTNFKSDLLEYVSSYAAPALEEWSQVIKRHDFSQVKYVASYFISLLKKEMLNGLHTN